MSESTRFTAVTRTTGSKQKLAILLAGTAVAILAAGILIQILRAEPGISGEEQAPPRNPANAGVAQTGNPHRYLAAVNGERITYDEVAQECVARFGKDVLDSIVNRTIIQQACKKQGISVTEAEVQQEIIRIAKRFDLDVDNWLKMLEAERGLSPMQYQRDIIWPMLALKRLAGENVTVTQEDMQKAYERDFGPKVKARMILMDNIRRAQTVWAELHKKNAPDSPPETSVEKFERMAREFSIEPNSRALGGVIPPIRMHTGNDELTRAAFKLREGEISGLVQIGTNYAIILCEGRIPPIEHDKREVQESLYEQLREEKTQQAVARIFEQIKEQAVVDNYLTGVRTGSVQQASGTRQGGVVPAAGTRPAGNSAGAGSAATAPRTATSPAQRPTNAMR